MAGYIGTKSSVTQVDGYNRTEADDRYVNVAGDTMTGPLRVQANIGTTALFASDPSYDKFALNTESSGWSMYAYDNDGTWYQGLRMNGYGQVTKPYQPIWGGRHSGGNLNDFVTMYNDPDVTNGSGWVLAGGGNERLYPPVSGWYQITMTGLANPSVNTSVHTQAYLYKSGVSQYNACAGTTDYTRMILHAYLYLTPTDWISFYTGGTAMHTDQAYNKVTCMLVA